MQGGKKSHFSSDFRVCAQLALRFARRGPLTSIGGPVSIVLEFFLGPLYEGERFIFSKALRKKTVFSSKEGHDVFSEQTLLFALLTYSKGARDR